MNYWTRPIIALTLTLAPLASVDAASPEHCAPTVDMDPLQLLRQVSLDLRGHGPTYEEYEWVRGADEPHAVVEELVEQILESDAYFDEVRRYHRALMWGSLDRDVISTPFASQRILARNKDQNWRLPNMRRRYRGKASLDCLDDPQPSEMEGGYDGQGRPVPLYTFDDASCLGGTCQQEGYVEVASYWAPETLIKVCAFDAQEAQVGNGGKECSVYHSNDRKCGCGPELMWCGPNSDGMDIPIRESLAEEPARIFEWVVREGRNYLEAFTTDTTFMNGPVAHYYRHNTGTLSIMTRGAVAYEVEVDQVPDLPYEDRETWVPVERGGPHAGAFTTLGYLARFSSNRSRANRFATAFYCEPFLPKEDGLPPEEANPSPNLRERAGCNDCHERLEPLAAHWGRWRTSTTYGYFRPEEVSFTEPNEDCLCDDEESTCPPFCNQYFVTPDNSSDEEFGLYHGLPQASSWLEPADYEAVELGPVGLVDTVGERDRIANCAVRNLGEHLLGREFSAEDLTWLEGHAQDFAASGYDYTELTRSLIADERYRTIR